MVNHFGIVPSTGNVGVYNEKTKKSINYKIDDVAQDAFNKIDAMFEQIKSKINNKEKIGYTCIYLWENYNNEIRKSFIECGKQKGFQNTQIIDFYTLVYLNYISQANYQPKNGDIILILWLGNCYIWKKEKSKAKLLKCLQFASPLTRIKLISLNASPEFDKPPNLIIYDKNFELDLSVLKLIFCNAKYFLTNQHLIEFKAALIKARINGGDKMLKEFDAKTHLNIKMNEQIDVLINQKKMFSFLESQSLPLEKAFSVPVENDIKILETSVEAIFYEAINITPEMRNDGKIDIVLKIDCHNIFSTNFSNDASIEPPEYNYLPIKRKPKIETKHNDTKENNGNEPSLVKTIYVIPKNINVFSCEFNAVGIDLGTSRCCAAVNRRNGIETVALENTGERLLPSYVSFSEEKEKCGQIVVNHLQNNAKSTIYDSKRFIGRNFDEIKIDENWPFEVINVNDKPFLQCEGSNTFIEKYPEEITAVLLKHIKQKVEDFQGKILDEVVITVPTAFTDNQKEATIFAGILAGWKTVHLLPEPVGASIAYFIGREIPLNFNTLLFDFGGGTLDVCIFNVSNNSLQIISQSGDSNLGGRDFDDLLYKHFSGILRNQFNLDVWPNDKLKYLLLQKCMDIKHTLSVHEEARLDVNDFISTTDETLIITRENFEKMSMDLLNKIREVIMEVLSTANYFPSNINRIIFSGGSSRLPMVRLLLMQIFSNAEHCCEENPDEVVAIGAAYYAYHLHSKTVQEEP